MLQLRLLQRRRGSAELCCFSYPRKHYTPVGERGLRTYSTAFAVFHLEKAVEKVGDDRQTNSWRLRGAPGIQSGYAAANSDY